MNKYDHTEYLKSSIVSTSDFISKAQSDIQVTKSRLHYHKVTRRILIDEPPIDMAIELGIEVPDLEKLIFDHDVIIRKLQKYKKGRRLWIVYWQMCVKIDRWNWLLQELRLYTLRAGPRRKGAVDDPGVIPRP